MTPGDNTEAADGSPDYMQIGRFIYGTTRLEGTLTGLLRAMGQAGADADELAENVRQAKAMFGRLPAGEGDRIAFTALMHVLATFAEQRDAMFERISEMSAEELSARNDALAAASQEVRRFEAIVQALSASGEGA